MAVDKKISDINRFLPLLSDVVVAARDNSGNKINVTFTLAEILASITGAPFKITLDSEEYGTEEDDTDPDNIITNTVITDDRLIGKSGFPVYSTQTNTEFRNSDLVYDAVNGKVTIRDFQLIAGEHISIYPTLAPSNNGANYQDLLDQINDVKDELETVKESNQVMAEEIELLTKIAAPFIKTGDSARGGIVIWNRPANQIPSGWVAVTNFEGRFPMGRKGSVPEFDTVGKPGGSITYSLSTDNLPSFSVNIKRGNSYTGSSQAVAGYVGGGQSSNPQSDAVGTFTGSGIPYNVLNPFRIVEFIEYVG